MKRILLAFLVGLMVMGGGIYVWAARQHDPLTPKDEPKSKRSPGPFHTTETIAVGEVVNGIRQLNRLVIFQAYVTATTTTHDIGWITQSDQTMLTPAFVNYYIDLDQIKAADVRVKDNNVFVALSTIYIERPNIDTRQVKVFNDGIFSHLTGTSEELRIKNNKMALDQLVQRAKMPFLVEAALKAAAAAEEVNVKRILATDGHPNLNIHIVR